MGARTPHLEARGTPRLRPRPILFRLDTIAALNGPGMGPPGLCRDLLWPRSQRRLSSQKAAAWRASLAGPGLRQDDLP